MSAIYSYVSEPVFVLPAIDLDVIGPMPEVDESAEMHELALE